MTEAGTSRNVLAGAARVAARTISTLAALFWLLLLLDIITCEVLGGYICLDWETLLLTFLTFASIFFVLVAWRGSLAGGLFMIAWGLAFSLIAGAASEGKDLAVSVLVSGGPFVLSGILFAAGAASRNALGKTQKQPDIPGGRTI